MGQVSPNDVSPNDVSPNDLRHYRTRRIASELRAGAVLLEKPRIGMGPVGPALNSLDAVLDTVLETASGGLPRALLVAGTSKRANAVSPAIELARALVDRNEQVVLVDLAKGASLVSDPLGMPRVPGFSDLVAGEANFIDVVHLDDETTLQVIAAGNTATVDQGHDQDRFMDVFEALTQTYDCVVLHADLAAIEARMPALKFEFPVAVAVLPGRATIQSETEALCSFQSLGCPIVVYDGHGKRRRPRLFGRMAAA